MKNEIDFMPTYKHQHSVHPPPPFCWGRGGGGGRTSYQSFKKKRGGGGLKDLNFERGVAGKEGGNLESKGSIFTKKQLKLEVFNGKKSL